MQKGKDRSLGMFASLVIAFLSLSAFVGAAAFADDNQEGSSIKSDSENVQQDQEDQENDQQNQEEQQRESAKQQLERQRETAKQQFERQREAAKNLRQGAALTSDSTSDNEDGDNQGEDQNGGRLRSGSEILSKLQERLAEAEQKILEKQAEGVDVTVALARLADAKAKVAAFSSTLGTNTLGDAKQLSEEARKLTHFALNEDLLDPEKIAEGNQKSDERMNQVREKIAKLKALGGDTTSFEAAIAEAQTLLDKAKAELASGDTNGVADLHAAQEKINTIKSNLRAAIFALRGKDDQFGDDHKTEVEDVADNLDEVADIEDDSVGPRIRVLANAERHSADKVSGLVQDAQSRGKLAEFLIGAKQDALSKLTDEINNNNGRITVLQATADQVQDPEVKQILDEQIASLKEETAKLQDFVTNQSQKSGLFGWLRIFAPKF